MFDAIDRMTTREVNAYARASGERMERAIE